MPFDKPWGQPDVQTATTSSNDLSQTLGDMLPMPERPPPQDRPFEQFLNQIPDPPWATTAKYGGPILGAMYGGALGPSATGVLPMLGQAVTTGLGAATGEAGAELAQGQPLDTKAIGWTGATNAAAVPVARMARGAYGAVRSLAGQGGVYGDVLASSESVPLTTLKQTVDDMIAKGTSVSPSPMREATTGYGKLRNNLQELSDMFTNGTDRSFGDVNEIRKRIGQFMQEAKTMDEARGLYGALMTDLRNAVASGESAKWSTVPGSADRRATGEIAAKYLSALSNDSIARALMPETFIERMLLYGVGGLGLAAGHGEAALPALGLLGLRGLSKTPPSILDQAVPAASNLYNPYRTR